MINPNRYQRQYKRKPSMFNALFRMILGSSNKLSVMAEIADHMRETVELIEDNIAHESNPTAKNEAIDAVIAILQEMKDKEGVK
jgi:hypothetical protein